MSQANVELVLALTPSGADFAQVMRDENFSALSTVVAHLFQPDFECVSCRFDAEKTYVGLDGLRDLWLEWLAPWTTYRSEAEEAMDLGDRVLLLVRDFGRREGSTDEIALKGASIWNIRDGKIARVEFYPVRDDALKAAGLAT